MFCLLYRNYFCFMKRKIRLAFFLFAAALLAGCEKDVTFDIKEASPKLVVEATIENGEPPVVFLSKSLSFYSKVDPAAIAGSFVRDAFVYVSNGTVTHRLKEYVLPVGGGYYFFYYSVDPASPSTLFYGELKKSYSLRIVIEGEEYTASTTIPDTTRRIDSVFWKPAPPGNPDGKVSLMLRATDKPGFGDYIRYFTKRNDEPFYPGINSVFDDQVIDGSSYEVQVERGLDRSVDNPAGSVYFDKGDTITLKLCSIDKQTFDFWRTMEFNFASIGNPFSTPTKVQSNISGGALGYFGGYGAQLRKIIVPR